MAEQLDLTTPITSPALTSYTVGEVHLVSAPGNSRVTIVVIGSTGARVTVVYADDVGDGVPSTNEATLLIRALNTANLSVKSLQRRVLERVMVDHPTLFAGTISGAPD